MGAANRFMCTHVLGAPGIISVRIHVDKKDGVIFELINDHLFYVLMCMFIYPYLAIIFFLYSFFIC